MENYSKSGQKSNKPQHDFFPVGSLFRRAWDEIFPAGPASPLCGGVGPLGFITTPISLTEYQPLPETRNLREILSQIEVNGISKMKREIRQDFLRHQVTPAIAHQWSMKYEKQIALGNHPARSVFRINRYKSGEILGTQVKIGGKFRHALPVRSEQVVTYRLSDRANKALRRAVENSSEKLSKFVTLTFSPADCPPWTKNFDGTIRHDFAKYKLGKFLHTCSVAMQRKGTPLDYLWVAEIQTGSTGNIHFHVLCNRYLPIKWLTKIWGQASNSVDIETVKDSRHACNYIRKYLAKQVDVLIEGNRYGITSGLRETMKPEIFDISNMEEIRSARSSVHCIADEIKTAGGYISEWGFCIGVPTRSKAYRSKSGEIKYTKALPAWLGNSLLDLIIGEVPF